MSKQIKNKFLIILAYLISLFIFELIIGVGGFERSTQECIKNNYFSPLMVYVPMIEAGIYHFIIVSIIAVVCVFYKKLDKNYKKIIYFFPITTFYLSFPMWMLSAIFCKVFGIYGLEM